MAPMKILLSALLTGLLFALSLPPFHWEWLGWAAFVPLLLAARSRRPLEAVGLGMVAGAFCGVVQAGWNHDTARLFWAYIPFLWLAFLFGVVALASARIPETINPIGRVLLIASVGVGGEWLTSFLPLPLNIALCQYQNLPLIQITSLAGIWGVSFLLWWVNAALAECVQRRKFAPLGLGAALVIVSLGYGAFALHTTPARPKLRVAAIQDLTRDETGDLAPALAADPDRVQMTKDAAARGATLIVWSEESLGGEFTPTDPKDETRQLARKLKTALVVGYSDNARPKPFNCAAFLAPDGTVLGPVHHKVHLYLAEQQTNQSGHRATVVSTQQGPIGLEICFDSCYTGTTRETAQAGARLIAMPNYDPPTPHGILHRLHGAMLPFRAAENGVPFVRADSNGLSQIVDAQGRILAQSPLYVPDILVADVPLGTGHGTFFTRFGDWLAYLCLLIVAAGVVRYNRHYENIQSIIGRRGRDGAGVGEEPQ
jgi:apolipoprotein N-acyltransferase